MSSFVNSSIPQLDFNNVESAFHDAPAAGMPRPIERAKREIRVYYLVPTRMEWLAASGANSQEFGEQREKARPFADAPGAFVGSATEEGVAEVKPDLGVVHEPLPNDLAGALAETNESMTTPLVVFDRRALKLSHLRTAAVSYASRNFQNTGFVTVAGRGVPDSEINTVYGSKIGALPKLHNWIVPAGRSAYVRNVASVINELEAQLVRRQSDKLNQYGEAIWWFQRPSSGSGMPTPSVKRSPGRKSALIAAANEVQSVRAETGDERAIAQTDDEGGRCVSGGR